MTFRDSRDAFEQAISAGWLSTDPDSPKFAGNYMYMGTDEFGIDLFKNILTRKYDV